MSTQHDAIVSPLENYVRRGFRHVHAWLTPEAVQLISQVANAQTARGIRGPVCEIGVHHGKLFTLLHLLEPVYAAGAIDLFEAQAANVDGSGYGDHARLLENVRRNGGDLSRVRVLTGNSLQIQTEQVIELCGGRPRLFSVDGGHSAECTYNDLRLATESSAQGGVVILDDYFNPSWPGVAEGTCQFMHDHRGALILIAIGGNKVLFAKDEGRSYAKVCEEVARQRAVPLRERFARSWLWRQVRRRRT